MKKLSAVQRKQQTLVFDIANRLEEQAREEIPGIVQCWFEWEKRERKNKNEKGQ